MRASRKNQTNDMTTNRSESVLDSYNGSLTNPIDQESSFVSKQEPSFVLSTEICIYIHGALIGSVFVIGLMRCS